MKTEIVLSSSIDNLESSLENKSEVMGYDENGKFTILKKCLILYTKDDPRFSYDPDEILLPLNQYYLMKNYVELSGSHYIPESEVYIFFGMDDFWNTMINAYKNKMF